MPDTLQNPVSTIEQKAPKPPGLMPKNLQAMIIFGIALVMVVIMALTGHKPPNGPKASGLPALPTPVPIQNDSLSDDPNLNTEVSVLNKVNATNVLALQNAQDTNKLLVAVLEQQTILAKHLRDAEASAANADIERRLNSFNFNQQLTARIGANLNGYRLP